MSSLFESTAAPRQATSLPHPAYRPDIDGLRAIAVLAVVLFHAFPTSVMKGGFVGVDVFFVISGFLIGSIIIAGLQAGSFSFLTFFARRINRILPALLLVLLACWAFGAVLLFSEEYMQLGKHIAAGASFVSNFVLLGERGYFDTSSDSKILLHLWSLGIEEQFYLLWPLLLWAAWKLRCNLLALTLVLAVVSFAINLAMLRTDADSAFYLPHARFWELLAGAALAWIALRRPQCLANVFADARPCLRNSLSLGGFALILLAFAMIDKDRDFPGWWALMPVAGAVMLIAAGPFGLVNRTLLSNRFMVGIGLISYPLYLWHWPLLTFARVIEGAVPAVEIRAALVVLALVLAWLTWRLLELPLKRRQGRFKTVVLCSLLVAMGLAGYYTFAKGGLPERSIDKGAAAVAAQFTGSFWPYMRSEGCEARYPYPAANDLAWWFCMESEPTPPTLMLIGTSFANQLFPGLAQNPATAAHSILSIGTCDPAGPDIITSAPMSPVHPCFADRPLEQKRMIESLIDRTGTVEYAILAGLTEDPDTAYGGRLERYIGTLERKGVKVIVFLPHIPLTVDPRACFARPLGRVHDECALSYERFLEINRKYAPIIRRIEASHPEVRFFDQKVLTCGDGTCWSMLDGMPLYRDTGHFSEYASVRLAELFVEWAKVNTPGILGK